MFSEPDPQGNFLIVSLRARLRGIKEDYALCVKNQMQSL